MALPRLPVLRAIAHDRSRREVAIADLRTSAGGSLMIGGIRGPLRQRLSPLIDQPRSPAEVTWPDSITVMLPDVDEQFEHVREEGRQSSASRLTGRGGYATSKWST